MKPDDIRAQHLRSARRRSRSIPTAPWPRPGEVTAIIATAVAPAVTPTQPSIRAIVLNPSRYLDQKVAITGQFSGRNLLGEMPDAPGKSRYDFVLRSSDAAIWVSNMRPRLKDANGKDMELGLDARIDTGRWLSLRGTVEHGPRAGRARRRSRAAWRSAKAPTETTPRRSRSACPPARRRK